MNHIIIPIIKANYAHFTSSKNPEKNMQLYDVIYVIDISEHSAIDIF